MGEVGDTDTTVSCRSQGVVNFYRGVAQVVLLFGCDTLVLLVAMERKVEGAHTDFLRKITGKQVRQISDRTWETPRAEVVREVAVTQSSMTYIGRRQATLARWVALQQIFEVCAG